MELPKLRGGPYCAADCHTVGTGNLKHVYNYTWAASRVRGPKEDKSPMVCVPNPSAQVGR